MSGVVDLLGRLTRNDLLGLARAAGISGRSTMSKDELLAAVLDHLDLSDGDPHVEASPSRPDAAPRCGHQSERGNRCGLPVLEGGSRCVLHSDVDLFDRVIPIAGRVGFDTWPELLRQLALGMYDTDPLGLDPVAAEMMWHIINFLYRDYFRVDVTGTEHIPGSGAAVLAANHAGAALPYDAVMMSAAVANEAPTPRRVRTVGTEILNMVPFVSHWYRKAGGAYASREDAQWILGNGHLLGVFPEGVAGFQKAQRDAYTTQRFGRGGFVDLAMRAGAPIIPVAIVGSEEVHPVLFTSKRLAALVRMVFPQQRVEEMAVFINPLPLPVKWYIEFLEPIDVGPATDRPDRLTVLELSEEVRGRIQTALDRTLARRDSIF